MQRGAAGESTLKQPGLGRTSRRDAWWLTPAATFAVLSLFIVYATYRAFQGASFEVDNYISPFYSPKLVFDWWKSKQTVTEEDDTIDKESNWLYKMTVGSLGTFWATVALVELMDMAFSIDNVFAAVAFTPNIILVCIGVFIGILAMRFIAQWFVTLMEKYTFLETAAFVVIGILGVKLVLSLYEHFYPESVVSKVLQSHSKTTYSCT